MHLGLMETALLSTAVHENATINILVVDDSSTCRVMTRKALLASAVACDLNCDMASDGQSAVDMVRNNLHKYSSSHPSSNSSNIYHNNADCNDVFTVKESSCQGVYDIVIIDYQMPIMAGPEAIRQIRKLGYRGMIVGLTGNVLVHDMNVMLDAGAERVLAKPVNQHELEMLIIEKMK